MKTELEALKEALGRRDALCTEILNLTEGTRFSMSKDKMDDEALEFIELYDRRGKLAEELSAVHNEIGEAGYTLAKESADPEAAELLARSNESLKKIISIDRNNTEIGAAFMENTKTQVKRINQGRNLSLKYSGELTGSDGFILDNKN